METSNANFSYCVRRKLKAQETFLPHPHRGNKRHLSNGSLWLQPAGWEREDPVPHRAKKSRGGTGISPACCASVAHVLLTCKSGQAQSWARSVALGLGSQRCHCSQGKADLLRSWNLTFLNSHQVPTVWLMLQTSASAVKVSSELRTWSVLPKPRMLRGSAPAGHTGLRPQTQAQNSPSGTKKGSSL